MTALLDASRFSHLLPLAGGGAVFGGVEYAVMLALIIVVCLVAITAIGTNVNKTFSNVSLNVTAS